MTGEANIEPPLPPQIDTTRGWPNAREAIQAGAHIPADVRHVTRLQAQIARRALSDLLAMYHEPPDPAVNQQWVDGLTDTEVLAQLNTFSRDDPLASAEAARTIIRKAQRPASRPTSRPSD